jgi:hypothetical protein
MPAFVAPERIESIGLFEIGRVQPQAPATFCDSTAAYLGSSACPKKWELKTIFCGGLAVGYLSRWKARGLVLSSVQDLRGVRDEHQGK